jgi:hypothetical protein
MSEAQEWLSKNFPITTRADIKKLSLNGGETGWGTNSPLNGNSLHGSLKITEFPNLEEINCSANEISTLELVNLPKLSKLVCDRNGVNLTKLIVNNCPEINSISCQVSQLIDLDFLNNLDPKKMTCLNITESCSSNCLPQNLSIFSEWSNLEVLRLGSNPFFGSLECLENLTRIKTLSISNTDIEGGLEYLPESLEKFCCFTSNLRGESKVKFIEQQLKPFLIDELLGKYDWKRWKSANIDLVENKWKQKVAKLEDELEIERDHSKDINDWYQKILKAESAERHIELFNEILELKWIDRTKQEEIEKLTSKLDLLNQISESELEAKNQELEKKEKEFQEKLNVMQVKDKNKT